MPAAPFARMPDDARLWVFAADRALEADEAALLLARVDEFLERWAAHGTPVLGARELRHGRFLLVASDERASGVSGCSIDSLFHALGAVEQELEIDLRGAASRVFFRDASGEIRSAERGEFRRMAAEGALGEDTPVFDNTVADVGALNAGRWETRFGAAWHARAFPLGAGAA
jgi:hypothetical protein